MAAQKKEKDKTKARFRDAYRESSMLTKVLVVILSIVAIIAFAMAVVYIDRRLNPAYPISHERYSIAIDGEIVCLPRPGDGPHTLECRLGLRDDEGNYLKIDDDARYDELHVGDLVRVKGIFELAEEDEPYDVSGTVYSAQIRVLQPQNDRQNNNE